MRRFFIDTKCIESDKVVIKGPEAHHIKDVIRLKCGDRFIGLDGKGKTYTLRVIETGRHIVACIEKISSQKTTQAGLLLACALAKNSKMDYIFEKATELGVEDIIPMVTERTIVRLDAQAKTIRQRRWQKIAVQASKQSGRIILPRIHDIISFADSLALAVKLGYNNRIIPFVSEGAGDISDFALNKDESSAVFIGPEGDFTQKEIMLAGTYGFKPVSLGSLVLKVDTACIFAISVLSARYRC